jgi:hypothetical protein
MTKTITQTAAHLFSQYEFRLRAAQVLMAICAFLAIMYAANLYSIISDTVALKQIKNQTLALNVSVEELDTQYLALSSKITPDTLDTYGLETGEVSYFISRTGTLGRVALNGREL